jgi:hypothetical protein
MHISARTRPRNARLRPRGQVIPEGVIEAPGLSPARKPRINLRPTGDGEACEDPRTLRTGQEAARTGNDIRDLELISQHAERVMVHADQIAVTPRSGQFPARHCKSLLVSINSLFCTIKFPVPISRELSSNKLILLRSDGRLFAKRPDFRVSRETAPRDCLFSREFAGFTGLGSTSGAISWLTFFAGGAADLRRSQSDCTRRQAGRQALHLKTRRHGYSIGSVRGSGVVIRIIGAIFDASIGVVLLQESSCRCLRPKNRGPDQRAPVISRATTEREW